MTRTSLVDNLLNEQFVEDVQPYYHPHLQDGYEIILDNTIPDSVVREIHSAGYDIREGYREQGKFVMLIFEHETLAAHYDEKLPHLTSSTV